MFNQLTIVRTGVALLGLTMCVLMFGPFQGLEERLGLTDKLAHGTAFYLFTLGVFVSFPHRRRVDLALVVMLAAGTSEIIQSFIGRSMSFADFSADSAGVAVAMLPAAIERFRYGVRSEQAVRISDPAA